MKDKILNILKLENTSRVSQIHHIMLLIGVLVMIITYRVTGGSYLSMVSGVLGVFSVLLCSDRKVAFYLFGFAQLITYVILCVEQKLYGEIVENAFYFITMIYGLYLWMKNYNYDEAIVETRSLNIGQKAWVFIGTLIGVFALSNILFVTDDTQPFMDAITTVPAFVAQILMIARYKDSWYYWLSIDIGSIIMWAIAGDWCMVAQFVFWTINCFYGLRKW